MTFKRKDKRTKTERYLDDLLEDLARNSTTFEDAADLVKLLKARKELEESKTKVSPNTIAVVAGNLLGILLILGYEQTSLVTSKALSLIMKARI